MSDERNSSDGFSKVEENYTCDNCEFTNQSMKGIKTHVTRQHKEVRENANKKITERNTSMPCFTDF